MAGDIKNLRQPEAERVPPPGDESRDSSKTGGNRKILVLAQEPTLSEAVADYAVNLAQRLGYDLIMVHVGPDSTSSGFLHSPYRRFLQEKFIRAARKGAALTASKARQQGVAFEHLVRFGEPGQVLSELHRTTRRIEFVLNAAEMNDASMAGSVTLPVFTITNKGASIMAGERDSGKLKMAAKTAAWGVGAAALYAAVFMNSTSVTALFSQGGWFAALPILTVFLFSFVHGTFSHYVWELLGIHAPQQTVQPQPTAAKRPTKRQRPRPRLRLNV
jgi:nucleotide-binding universal stress UspA family protein